MCSEEDNLGMCVDMWAGQESHKGGAPEQTEQMKDKGEETPPGEE